MIHIPFDRPTCSLKVYDIASLRYTFQAQGDAVGNYVDGVRKAPLTYELDASIAPGHYRLTYVEALNPRTMAEGAFQIYVDDLRDRDVSVLLDGEKASRRGDLLDIGGLVLPIGGLARYGRSEIMLHGGGSCLGVHCYDARQPLCKTCGCTRLHNDDLVTLAAFLTPQLRSARMIVFSVVGDPPPASC